MALAPVCVGVGLCRYGVQHGAMRRGKVVLTSARDHERLVPRIRPKGYVEVVGARLVGEGAPRPVRGVHGHGASRVADAQALSLVQQRPLGRIDREEYAEYRRYGVSGRLEGAFPRSVLIAALVKAKRVARKARRADGMRRRHARLQPCREHVGAVRKVMHGGVGEHHRQARRPSGPSVGQLSTSSGTAGTLRRSARNEPYMLPRV